MPLNMEAEISMRSFRMFIALWRGATQEQLAMFSTQTGDLKIGHGENENLEIFKSL